MLSLSHSHTLYRACLWPHGIDYSGTVCKSFTESRKESCIKSSEMCVKPQTEETWHLAWSNKGWWKPHRSFSTFSFRRRTTKIPNFCCNYSLGLFEVRQRNRVELLRNYWCQFCSVFRKWKESVVLLFSSTRMSMSMTVAVVWSVQYFGPDWYISN